MIRGTFCSCTFVLLIPSLMTQNVYLDLNDVLPFKRFIGQQVLPVLGLDVQLLYCLRKIFATSMLLKHVGVPPTC
jgi:hypothetical protein